MAQTLETPKYLFPASYKYYLLGQYFLFGAAIVVFGDFVISVIIEVVQNLSSEEGFNFSARLSSDLALCVFLLAAAAFTHRHKERIRLMISNWSPMTFDEPIWVTTGVKDSNGEILDCWFEAEMTLWFADEESADAASKIQGRIRGALKLFLEEASQDPVLRRSKNYLNDWVNESFKMQDLQKIEIRSTKFYPAPLEQD